MEALLLPLLILVLILLIVFNSGTNSRIERLQIEIRNLQLMIRKNAEQAARDAGVQPSETISPTPNERWKPSDITILAQPTEAEEAPPVQEVQPPVLPEPESQPEPVIIPEVEPEFILPVAAAPQPDPADTPPPVIPPAPPKPGFFERNPDLEKFIGENLVSKIGIAILVIAIGFFVKFAIDNDWIGPVGRVGIGLLCGGILVGLAHKLQRAYKAFSSVLIGGGLAVFYFSIALAYKDYHLFGQTAAFIIMVVITLFAVLLSLLYDRQEVAVIAMVGGFCVPFIVSDGSGNYVTLFIYLLVLNTGLLAIAYRKAWRLLNVLAFLFTVFLFAGWIGTTPRPAPVSAYKNGLLFASLFYLLFLAINIAHNVKQQKKFIASDFSIILANTGLYFATGLYMIHGLQADSYTGLFSGTLGAFNLLLCFLLIRNKNIDRNVLYLLIGITLTFISLTIPLQLKGHFITLFWASEAVLLYWLYGRSKISLIKIASLAIWACMLISLFLDWSQIYLDKPAVLTVLFNKGFITTLYTAVATYLLYVLRNKEMQAGDDPLLPIPRQVFLVVAVGLLYMTGALELNYQLDLRYPDGYVTILYLLSYTFAFILILHVLGEKQRLQSIPKTATIALLGISVFVYLVSLPAIFDALTQFLLTGKNGGHFMLHWLGALLTGIIIYRLISWCRRKPLLIDQMGPVITWGSCLLIVVFISVELNLLMSQLFYGSIKSLGTIHRVFIKAGLPIIWGLCSFIFMWLGMRHKYRPLRIVSLTLFLVTLLKLFIYDIQNIPVAGKIAAFFCLGVLLLVVSFMYQRLKKIIEADEPKNDL